MAEKRTKKDYAPHIERGKAPRCEEAGCKAEGIYKAPKARSHLHEYRYYCLDHIREHNKKWDYFSGMDADEIEAFMKDAVTGHRPTWEREIHVKNPQEKLYAAIDEFLNIGRRKTKPIPRLGVKMQKALSLFELNYPYTTAILKKQYKELVKRYHPDKNHGDKLAEEKFKAVVGAYKTLESHLAAH